MSLKGRVLFITGGSRGIGLEIGKRAAKDGAKVVLAAKTAEPHPKLPGTIYTAADEIVAAGGEALPIILDVRDEINVREAVEQTVSHFGGIDILSLIPISEPNRRTPISYAVFCLKQSQCMYIHVHSL